MSAMGNLLVEQGERLLVARGLDYSEETWDAIMDELMNPPRLTPVEAARVALEHPEFRRLFDGHRARRVERMRGGIVETDHAAADEWLIDEVERITGTVNA